MEARTLAFNAREFDIALARVGLRSISKLAAKAGIARSTAYLIRRGWTPGRETQERVAQALDTTVAALWSEVTS